MPGHDAGDTTSVVPVDAWIAFDSDGGSVATSWSIRVDQSGPTRLTTESSMEAQPAFRAMERSSRTRPIETAVSCEFTRWISRTASRPASPNGPRGSRPGVHDGRDARRLPKWLFCVHRDVDGTDERQSHRWLALLREGGTYWRARVPERRSYIYDDYNAIYSTSGTARTNDRRAHDGRTIAPGAFTRRVDDRSPVDLCRRQRRAKSLDGASNVDHGLQLHGRASNLERRTDATHASWGPNELIVWGSVTGGTNSTSPVSS